MKVFFWLLLLWLLQGSLLTTVVHAQTQPSLEGRPLPAHFIQMHFDDVPVKDLFYILATLGGVDFIGMESLTTKTSIHFHRTPWNVVFAYLLANQGLHSYATEHSIFIGSAKEILEMRQHFLQASTALKGPSTQQVLIEARIVEADYRFARNLGLKLGYQASNASPHKASIQSKLLASGLNGFEAPFAAITMLNKGATALLDLELSALEADGQGSIIANPRIVTANKTLATIAQGTELPYQSTSREGSKVQFRKASLKLEVTPTIEDQYILLDVEISKDSVGMKTEQGFAINTKHLKSQILIEDGGTVVIGGIYLQTEREDVVKVPWLGDLPLLGSLFQHRARLKDKTELLVFLTPSLIDHQGNAPQKAQKPSNF